MKSQSHLTACYDPTSFSLPFLDGGDARFGELATDEGSRFALSLLSPPPERPRLDNDAL